MPPGKHGKGNGMKYYTFNLPLNQDQIKKMQDAFAECIGPETQGSGLFCMVNFKTGTLRGMIMPPDVCSAFRPALDGVLAASQKDEMGNL
jgi:hypothetical protein